jgi:hypothetical protein
MYTRGVVLILLFASVAAYSIAELPAVNPGDQSIVTTDRGPVRGVVTTTLRMYLGIPYAAPPVGRLRWRPPIVHERWSTPLNATKFGDHCPQVTSVFWDSQCHRRLSLLECLHASRIRRGQDLAHISDNGVDPWWCLYCGGE